MLILITICENGFIYQHTKIMGKIGIRHKNNFLDEFRKEVPTLVRFEF